MTSNMTRKASLSKSSSDSIVANIELKYSGDIGPRSPSIPL
jgi:hypothetical protein